MAAFRSPEQRHIRGIACERESYAKQWETQNSNGAGFAMRCYRGPWWGADAVRDLHEGRRQGGRRNGTGRDTPGTATSHGPKGIRGHSPAPRRAGGTRRTGMYGDAPTCSPIEGPAQQRPSTAGWRHAERRCCRTSSAGHHLSPIRTLRERLVRATVSLILPLVWGATEAIINATES